MQAVLLMLGLAAGFVLLSLVLHGLRKLFMHPPEFDVARRREMAGLCHACGYNLKGVESYMCPECGVVRLRPAARSVARKA